MAVWQSGSLASGYLRVLQCFREERMIPRRASKQQQFVEVRGEAFWLMMPILQISIAVTTLRLVLDMDELFPVVAVIESRSIEKPCTAHLITHFLLWMLQ